MAIIHKRLMRSRLDLGQTLFEVTIAVGIAAFILVAGVAVSTSGVRNSIFSRSNSLAVKYAQEGAEFLRQKRDEDWNLFITNLTSNSVINLGWSSASGFNQLSSAIEGTTFSRTYTTVCKLDDGTAVACSTSNNPKRVDIVVVVNWSDAQGLHEVKNSFSLTRWAN
jgi:hypothetical protein